MNMLVVFIGLISSLLAGSTAEVTNISVVTSVGTFIGFEQNVTIDGTTKYLSKYLGIPYAEAPIGDLRFEKPVPKATLREPMIVHKHGSECIQLLFAEALRPLSEDCLFLNVYAPEKEEGESNLPVMVWIHGGGYVFGSANIFVSDLLAVRGRVIVVTFNYRLSVLGFLNARDEGPGNFGLWDQHLAIRWVHDHIEAFGGDNRRVTIFGESAGAGSVIFQGLYPDNRGLFHRIIAESGTASAPWSFSLDPKAEAKEFANLVGCYERSTYEMVSCLKRVSFKNISDTLNDPANGFLFRSQIPFVPSLDGEFVTLNPRDILNGDKSVAKTQRATFADFDLMMGANSGESGMNVNAMMGVEGDPNNFLPNRTFFEDVLVPIFVQRSFNDDAHGILIELITGTYTTWDDPENPLTIRENFVDMYGDRDFVAAVLQTIDMHAEVSEKNSFMYWFTATPSVSILGVPSWLDRPGHMDELLYVFGEVNKFNELGQKGEFQEWEKELSKTIMAMWSNFAKTGNPNEPNNIGVDWQPYTESRHRYLEIAKYLNQTVTKERLHEDRAHLHNKIIPAVIKALQRNAGIETCNRDTSGTSSLITSKLMACLHIWIAFIVFQCY